jgi:hypothetical protein
MMDEQVHIPQVGTLWQLRHYRGTDKTICQILEIFHDHHGYVAVKFAYLDSLYLEYTQQLAPFMQDGEFGYECLS